jgi:ketosteroid isomerase-like protein
VTATTERTASDLAKAYLTALQAKDKAGIMSILAEDFTLEIPYNILGTNDFSDSWSGLEAADANYDNTFRKIEVLQYDELEFMQCTDPGIAFAEGLGVMTMANGNPYRNRYVFRFDTANGKIKRIREYLNPITSALSFGIALPHPQ